MKNAFTGGAVSQTLLSPDKPIRAEATQLLSFPAASSLLDSGRSFTSPGSPFYNLRVA